LPVGSSVTVAWYKQVENKYIRTGPARAHSLASQAAAKEAAATIHSNYSGKLAAQLAVAHRVTSLHSWVGSNLPYAGVEDKGGADEGYITSATKMYIRGRGISANPFTRSGSLRSSAYLLRRKAARGQPGWNWQSETISLSGITATAYRVKHEGKDWSGRAMRLYPDAFYRLYLAEVGA